MAELLCKYYKKQRFVSYNDGLTWQPLEEYEKGELYETHSASCGAGVFQYRWVLVDNAYICDGKDRYTREIYQYSEDGVVWYNTFPTQYRKGYLVESNSPFCDNAGGGQYIDDGTNPSSGTTCPPDYHWDGTECVCDGEIINGRCIVCKGGSVLRNGECVCTGNTYWNGAQCVNRPSGGGDNRPGPWPGGRWDPYKAVKCSNSNGILTSADTQYYSSGWAILSYEVGDCIYRLEDNTFNGQIYMTAVTIPSTVTEVGDWVFSNCESLPSVSFPTSALTELGEGTFNNCIALTSVTFEGTIPSAVSPSLFANCISLPSATWLQYNNITSISDKSFYNCYSLNNVTLPNSLTSIGNQAFYSNYAMENITIPSGVTSIGISAFENCTAMTFVNIDAVGGTKNTIRTPEYITKNGKSTYLDIDEVFTDDTVIEIEFEKSDSYYYSLIGDTSGKLDLHWNNGRYTAGNTLFFTYGSGEISGTVPFRNKKMHIQIGNKYVKDLDTDTYLLSGNSVSFTNTSGNIRLFKLSSAKNLTTANIYSVKIIKGNKIVRDLIPYTNNDNSKYYFFDKITKTIITSTAYYSADVDGFSGSSVVNEYVYDDPLIVSDSAFKGCTSLTAATFESSAVTIGNNVFSGCTRLLKLTFTSPIPFEIEDGDFDNTNECAIFVPCESEEAYKTAWSQYADRISCNDTGIYYRWVDDDGIYCDGYDQYTRQKQQNTTNGIAWTDTRVYRPVTFITHYSKECGYQGDVAITVTNADGFTRYYEPCDQSVYRTVTGTPYCSGATMHDKYVDTYYQVTYDDGETWVTTATTTALLETESLDCGTLMFEANYSNGVRNRVFWDGTTTSLTQSITKPSGYVSSAMTNAIIGDVITSIDNSSGVGYGVFDSCTSLSSVTIGSGVKSIADGVFNRCISLTSITVPSNVTSVGGSAFRNCSGLTNATIENGSVGSEVFYGCSSLTSVTFGNGVTSIGVAALFGCANLKNCIIGGGSMERQIFQGCTSLSSVTIGNGVTNIGGRDFWNCTSLTSINIPSSVTSIGNDAFYGCTSLSSVTIGSGVTSIGWSAFGKCSSLTNVIINALTPPPLAESDSFDGTNANLVIYVPAESVEAYKTESSWSRYTSRIQAIP